VVETLQEHLGSHHLFLTGGGGVGKSYLTSALIENYRNGGKTVIVLGSTGISAVHVGGQTLHSFFVLGIASSKEEMLRNDRYNKHRLIEMYRILERCDLLVIDEISMVSAAIMEMVYHRLLQGEFSGKVLLVGDFFQLPPVQKPKQSPQTSLFEEPVYAFESSAWAALELKTIRLSAPKRTQDREFFHILNAIREGENDPNILNYLMKLSTNLHVLNMHPTVLYGRNQEADFLNQERLKSLNTPPIILNAKVALHDASLHVKRFEQWKRSLPVGEEMVLKVGARVLFCTNKWGKYMNGEQGVVQEIEADSIWVEKDDGIVEVERHSFNFQSLEAHGEKVEDISLATIEQFPLKLAYAITIHKSQGMSIDALVCNIDHIFESSQFYVAISRAKHPDHLLLQTNKRGLESHLKHCIRVDKRVQDFYANLNYEEEESVW
jgi:ATP-dependent exoDNAse (exonuclease V) alpha subunit